MYLRTPRRYTPKGRRRNPINLRWLWLYILVPLLLIPLVLIWDYRDVLRDEIDVWIRNHPVNLNPPTPTATIAPKDYAKILSDAFQGGRIDKYISVMESFAIEVAPNDANVSSVLAQLIILRSAYSSDPNPAKQEEAFKIGQQAINANPEVADGWISMALVLDWSNKPQGALPYALRAKDIDDKNPMMLAVLGEIYHDLKRDDVAIKLIDQAIAAAQAANPVNRAALSHAYYVKAKILTVTSVEGQDAIDAYVQAWAAASSDPPDPTIPVGYIASDLSINYMNLQKPDLAMRVVTQAIDRDRDDPLLAYRMGMIYLNRGDPNKASVYFNTCHDLDASQPRCLWQLAVIAYREQNYNQALDFLRKIIDQNSKDMNVYLLAGKSYIAVNQCDSAIPVLQRGIPFIEDAQDRAALESALQQCGASAGFATEAPTATAVATTEAVKPGAKATPTPRKR
jgi:tetratricopeptide (TPR) repeat protein